MHTYSINRGAIYFVFLKQHIPELPRFKIFYSNISDCT